MTNASSFKLFFLLLIAVDFALLFSHSQVAHSQTYSRSYRYVKVLEVEGNVRFRQSFYGRWNRVRSQSNIPYGSTVQVDHNARLVVQADATDIKIWEGFRSRVDISQQIMFRVDDSLFRRVEFSQAFEQRVPDLSDRVKAAQNVKIDSITEDLENAWKRLKFSIKETILTKLKIAEIEVKSADHVKVGVEFKKIKVVTPVHNTYKISSSFPTEIELMWAMPKDFDGAIDVYVWPADGERKTPQYRSLSNRRTLDIPQEDSYYIQLMSQDQRYASDAILVHVVELARRVRQSKVLYEESTSWLSTEFPPPNMNFVTKEEAFTVDFRMDVKDISELEDLTLVLREFTNKKLVDKDGKELDPWIDRRFKIDDLSNAVKLKISVGEYGWWVEAKKTTNAESSGEGDVEFVKTPTRFLNIIDFKGSFDQSYLKERLRKEVGHRFYMADGI